MSHHIWILQAVKEQGISDLYGENQVTLNDDTIWV